MEELVGVLNFFLVFTGIAGVVMYIVMIMAMWAHGLVVFG